MLDLVETLFMRYGIQTLRFDGSMRRESREAVLAQFRKPGGPHVILIRYLALCSPLNSPSDEVIARNVVA